MSDASQISFKILCQFNFHHFPYLVQNTLEWKRPEILATPLQSQSSIQLRLTHIYTHTTPVLLAKFPKKDKTYTLSIESNKDEDASRSILVTRMFVNEWEGDSRYRSRISRTFFVQSPVTIPGERRRTVAKCVGGRLSEISKRPRVPCRCYSCDFRSEEVSRGEIYSFSSRSALLLLLVLGLRLGKSVSDFVYVRSLEIKFKFAYWLSCWGKMSIRDFMNISETNFQYNNEQRFRFWSLNIFRKNIWRSNTTQNKSADTLAVDKIFKIRFDNTVMTVIHCNGTSTALDTSVKIT